MKSKIYQGLVRHRRQSPKPHNFSYRLFMVYLDLAELSTVFRGRWLWSTRQPALARFRREDHLGDPQVSLDQAVRDLVEAETGQRPAGPIRLLTHLSYFGYCFNPVSFYYCFDDNEQLETIVAEVNNTPWGERTCYVLPQRMDQGAHSIKRFHPDKRMHVSPFMPMDVDYDWRFSEPGELLHVHMENTIQEKKIFDATLNLKRRPITGRSLAAVLLTFPFITLKVIVAIHYQALKLWLKKVPVFDHPDKQRAASEKSP